MAKHCVIDKDPMATQIANWLNQGVTADAINENLKKEDPEHRSYHPSVISGHRLHCLGLQRIGRKSISGKIKQTAYDVKAAEGVSDAEMLRTYKAALYDRLKRTPADVSTKELVSAISALSRGMPAEDPNDALTRAMGDLSDDEAAPSSSP